MGKALKDTVNRLPFYAKAALVIIGVYFFISMLSIGKNIIVPVIYATLFAIMLNHIANFLVRKGMNRVLAITLTLLLAVIITASIVSLLISQSMRFSETLPLLIDKLLFLLNHLVAWASGYFNISQKEINIYLLNTKKELLSSSSVFIGNTLTTVSSVLVVIFLIPVYIFMLMYYKPLLIDFVHRVFGSENDANVSEILTNTKKIVQNYLSGLMIEGVIVATLNSIGLLAFRIDYAIILGILGAILNLIPYLGGIIGVGLFMIVALLTKPPIYALYVLIIYVLIQFIDNHYIIPKVIGSKVKINAFVAILAVICGGALWGIPGMFLSIPLTAILKLIFERIDGLKPWGFLLADTMPPIVNIKFNLKNLPDKISGFKKREDKKKDISQKSILTNLKKTK